MTRSAVSVEVDRCRRIGLVEDHDVMVTGLRAILNEYPDLTIVAAADTVTALLSITSDLDLAILDLLLPDGSSPADNVSQLRSAGVEALVYTSGDRPDLVRLAAQAGVLGVIRKTERGEVVAEAIRCAANGEAVGSMDWAAAIDADATFVPLLAPRELETLALYAAGETAEGVAELLGVSLHTVNDNLKRIRQKYSNVGRPVRTKAELRRAAQEDGLAPGPWWQRNR